MLQIYAHEYLNVVITTTGFYQDLGTTPGNFCGSLQNASFSGLVENEGGWEIGHRGRGPSICGPLPSMAGALRITRMLKLYAKGIFKEPSVICPAFSTKLSGVILKFLGFRPQIVL